MHDALRLMNRLMICTARQIVFMLSNRAEWDRWGIITCPAVPELLDRDRRKDGALCYILSYETAKNCNYKRINLCVSWGPTDSNKGPPNEQQIRFDKQRCPIPGNRKYFASLRKEYETGAILSASGVRNTSVAGKPQLEKRLGIFSVRQYISHRNEGHD